MRAFEAACLLRQYYAPTHSLTKQHSLVFSRFVKLLPADDFVGEQNPLHLRVFDMVAPLILHNLKQTFSQFFSQISFEKLPDLANNIFLLPVCAIIGALGVVFLPLLPRSCPKHIPSGKKSRVWYANACHKYQRTTRISARDTFEL